MFENIISVLSEYKETIDRLNKECTVCVAEEDKSILDYFELSLAKALMQNRWVDSGKLAKIILASKDLSNEIIVKVL